MLTLSATTHVLWPYSFINFDTLVDVLQDFMSQNLETLAHIIPLHFFIASISSFNPFGAFSLTLSFSSRNILKTFMLPYFLAKESNTGVGGYAVTVIAAP